MDIVPDSTLARTLHVDRIPAIRWFHDESVAEYVGSVSGAGINRWVRRQLLPAVQNGECTPQKDAAAINLYSEESNEHFIDIAKQYHVFLLFFVKAFDSLFTFLYERKTNTLKIRVSVLESTLVVNSPLFGAVPPLVKRAVKSAVHSPLIGRILMVLSHST